MPSAPPCVTWRAPPYEPISERTGEVHIWHVRLDADDAIVAALERHLSDEERARADRFAFERLRREYRVAHGALREVLAAATRTSPPLLSFQAGPKGKPSLTTGGVEFNLSHSGSRALIAIARQPLGVDIEAVRPDFGGEAIAKRFFSENETRVLMSLPAARRIDAFFRCWTLKESFIKARGDGLSYPLDAFDVALHPDEEAALLRAADPTEVARWTMQSFVPELGYWGALCATRADDPLRVTFWRYEPGALRFS